MNKLIYVVDMNTGDIIYKSKNLQKAVLFRDRYFKIWPNCSILTENEYNFLFKREGR